MAEFLGRWAVSGVLADLCLAAAGARGNALGFWVLAAIWFGFWSAAVRPGVLRLGFSGRYVFWALFLALCLINGALFLGSATWFPWAAALPDRRGLLFAAVWMTVFSFALSSRFRGRDGRWHWISYHGAIRNRPAQSQDRP